MNKFSIYILSIKNVYNFYTPDIEGLFWENKKSAMTTLSFAYR